MKIIIDKNRGWRGLAYIRVIDEAKDNKIINKMYLSFSSQTWKDLLNGKIVIKNEDKLIVIEFNNIIKLPRPDQQRSVLIKNFVGTVTAMRYYPDTSLLDFEKKYKDSEDYSLIYNYYKNNNNHTHSEWNAVGIRANPFNEI